MRAAWQDFLFATKELMPARLQTIRFDPMLRGQPGGSQMAVKHKAKAVKTAEPDVSTDALLRYFRDMLLIRRLSRK